VQAASEEGTSAALFYLMTYAVMVFGAFAVITVVGRRGDDRHSLAEYRGLSTRQPMLAGLLTLFLLAQAGVPLTGGFVAKLSIFDAAVDAKQYVLALIGMLTAAISAFVYLRIVLAMYAPDPNDEGPSTTSRIRLDPGVVMALGLAAMAIVFLGVLPGFVLDFAHEATQLLAAGG